MAQKIMLLAGDGIGVEIMNEAKKLLMVIKDKFNLDIKISEGLIGGCSYDEYNNPLTDETLAEAMQANAVLLGAVGGYQWEKLPHHLKPEAALLKLRKNLELYANIRPTKVLKSLNSSSALKEEIIDNTDFVVLRELTGGIYYGEPRGFNNDKGWNTMQYERYEVERIVRKGFELAQQRKRKLTSIDKANVLEVSQFWRNITIELHKEYPDVQLEHMYVDNAAMQIVKNPKQFDVIVTSNLFGDILSDLAGSITGSLGMLPSASVGDNYALYEPIHGSAPDIAGKKLANPIAMLSSVAMMFRYSFNMPRIAIMIEKAIQEIIEEGYRTQDIVTQGKQLLSTSEMGDIIIKRFEQINEEVYIKI